MTYTDVWVGELAEGKDPLDWGGEWRIGNTPAKSLCSSFPPSSSGRLEPFSTVVDLIKTGVFAGKQVDWGAWAAVVSKQDILALLDDLYGTDPSYSCLEHLCEQLAGVRVAMQALPSDGRFALIADEF